MCSACSVGSISGWGGSCPIPIIPGPGPEYTNFIQNELLYTIGWGVETASLLRGLHLLVG